MNITVAVDSEVANILLELARGSVGQPRQRKSDLLDAPRALTNVQKSFSQPRETSKPLALRSQTVETWDMMPPEDGKRTITSNQ